MIEKAPSKIGAFFISISIIKVYELLMIKSEEK